MATYKAARVLGKRAAKFTEKLSTLRKFSAGFDSPKFEKLYDSKPRTAKAKAAKKAALQKITRAHRRLQPYIHRPHKLVRVRSTRNLETLKSFVGMERFKGLRAVPVPTDRAGKLKVTFDRKGRVTLKDGGSKQKVFLFPRVPRNHYRNGKIVFTITDDIIAMTEAMVKKMPPGQYVLHTRHNFLMPTMDDRNELASMVRGFANRYRDPEFLKMLRGFKWISGSYEVAQKAKEFMATERGRLKAERARMRSEAAARTIARMDRALKSGKLPKLSKRARATGRR